VIRLALLSSLTLFAPSMADAQLPDPARVVRTHVGSTLPARWPRRPLIDDANAAAGVLTVRERFGLDGAGAAVCVVDTGIDLGHRDFRDEDDRTRVSWLFDFESAPRGVHTDLEERFGSAVWTGAELDSAEEVPLDRNGHGTAVAAVAAGDDADVGGSLGPFAGAAPRASLIVVKLPVEDGLGFTDTMILRGTEACFSVGDPSRTVAVLAFGGHDGRHDGSEPLDVALDALAATGARIVVAAGNDGDRAIHAAGTLGSRAVVPLPLLVPRPEAPAAERFVTLSITAAASTRITVTGPDGNRVGPVGLGQREEAAGQLSQIVVDGSTSSDPRTGAIYIVIGGSPADVGSEGFGGDYEIAIEASGRFDAWIVDEDLGDSLLGPRFAGPFVERSGTIAVPGTAASVITVGASITKTMIATTGASVSIDGNPGEVATFSSVGPPPGASPKPDLVAPGALVVTALSSDVVDGDPDNLFRGAAGRVERHRVAPDRLALTGTSFTAPLVAGVLALGMADGADEADVARLLFSARPIDDAPWNGTAGFGLVDAAAFLAPEPTTPTSSLSATAAVDVGSPRLFIVGRVGLEGAPYTGPVDLFEDDILINTVPATAGLVRSRISTPSLVPGETLTLEARVNGTPIAEIPVRGRIDAARERVPPYVRGGGAGCAAGGRARHRDPVPAVLLLVVLVTRRGKRPRWRGARRRGASRPLTRPRRAAP